MSLILPAAIALADTDPAAESAGAPPAGTPQTRVDGGPTGPTGPTGDANPPGATDPTTGPEPAVDTIPPDVAIESGPSGPVNDPLPTFNFASPDASATLDCSLATGTAAFEPCPDAGSYRPTSPLADGAYEFSVRATDLAGNSTTAGRRFSVDTQAPEVTIESGPTESTEQSSPTFTFASPDDSATLECSIDGGDPSFGRCSGDGSDRPASPLDDGSYTFRVQATDAAGNSAVAAQDFEVADPERAKASADTFKSSAPKPVPAWYMTARTERDLRRQAHNDTCAFARRQPNHTRVLLMDFGKATRTRGSFGTQLRTGPKFSNQDVLHALKAAANAYKSNGKCYRRGSVRITYGNTNNMPNWMTRRNIRKAGRRQARMAHRLEKYQRGKGRAFRHQGVAVAGDIEPQWNHPHDSEALVSGATFRHRGGLFFNYGAASQCPPETSKCANRWDFKELSNVSYGGVKRALPEIYRRVHAKQWTRVRRRWNQSHRAGFCFSGTTATPGFPLSSREGWARLRAENKCVKHELVNIQEQ